MVKKTLLLSYLITLVFISFGQNDNSKEYFVTNEGKTIYGNVIRKFDDKQKPYYEFKTEKNQLFDAREVKSFKTKSGDLFFNSYAKDGFARQILTGKLDLYVSWNDEFIIEDENDSLYYLREIRDTIQSDGKVFIRKTNSWIGTVKILTEDCQEKELEKLKFNEKIITEFFIDYHNCIGSSYTLNNESTKWLKTQIGLTFGISNNNLAIAQQSSRLRYYPKETNNQSYFGGIDVFFTFTKKNNDLSYSSGLYFQENTFNTSFLVDIPEDTRYSSTINYSMLTIPLMINYTVDLNQFKIMFSGGANINTIVSQDVNLIEEKIGSNESKNLNEEFYLILRPVNLGINFKAALYKTISASQIGIFASYVVNNNFGLGEYNYSQPYNASISMLQFGVQLIR